MTTTQDEQKTFAAASEAGESSTSTWAGIEIKPAGLLFANFEFGRVGEPSEEVYDVLEQFAGQVTSLRFSLFPHGVWDLVEVTGEYLEGDADLCGDLFMDAHEAFSAGYLLGRELGRNDAIVKREEADELREWATRRSTQAKDGAVEACLEEDKKERGEEAS
jgi:hypothetical protein